MNVEELCGKPIKFRDWIFFTLVLSFILSWAFHIGAGDAATSLSKIVSIGFLITTLAYCLWCYYRYQAYLKNAYFHYDNLLMQMNQRELKRFINDDSLSPLSKRLAHEHYHKRFEKTEIRA